MPVAEPHQVLVRIHASGICYTDGLLAQMVLSFWDFPFVLGHEGVGEVVAVGESVTTRKVGDRVGLPITTLSAGGTRRVRGRQHDQDVSGLRPAATASSTPIGSRRRLDGRLARGVAVATGRRGRGTLPGRPGRCSR
ncbi:MULTISPECIES: alcohol dehydrogenase catalytic domain-containing protein [unclassified Pseudofrankia]|uniref:alcohol dehydrogenase catalytic domain-containing protein n=1 Tax=unclassified Pseudofrankia TaxID=2994372 RepID=UPI0009F5CBA9|nr:MULTISPECIES: alcohol dehydrogenase catalytic domain-containing protein [unclassified Pseudofrankia]MDT3445105.1 alcohol dehydrogenase catalytic domain-containing protein [Pseudofrankia sp. BMG5.37]